MIPISIVTPCSRPTNLHELKATIPDHCEWIVVVDGTSPEVVPADIRELRNVAVYLGRGGIGGSAQRNVAIPKARGQYVCFLDDDNILHPDYFREVLPLLDGKRVVVVNQVWADGERRLVAGPPIRTMGIDTGQVTLPTSLAWEFEWRTNILHSDGDYFGRIWEKYSDRFVFVHKDLSYYNYLTPRPTPSNPAAQSLGGSSVTADMDPLLGSVASALDQVRNRIGVKELKYIERFVQAELLKRSGAGDTGAV